MDEGDVFAARIPLKEKDSVISAEELCARAASLAVRDNTKLLFVFSPAHYRDIERFVTLSNGQMPGVQMIGGVVDWNDIIGDAGFVFDENGWSGQELILAALSGDALECAADFATGVQIVGDPHEITEVRGDHILGVDGKTGGGVPS